MTAHVAPGTSMKVDEKSGPDHVYEQIVAATGIDPAALSAEIARGIVEPLRGAR